MNLQSILETILFVHGEPITLGKLASLTKKPKKEVEEALRELDRDMKERGIVLLYAYGAYQLGSNPENSAFGENLMKEEFSENLSRQSLETLAIVAYKGPMTRIEIDYIRGVNSAFVLRNLTMRGLVERIENPKDARSWLYRVSFNFLKYLGLQSLEELPHYAELAKERVGEGVHTS